MAGKIAIAGGVRTPFTKAGTSLSSYGAVEIGRMAVAELIARTGIDPGNLDSVIMGNVAQPVEAVNVSRVIALLSGVPEHVPAFTVHRNCASGMQSIVSAAQMIATGHAQMVVAGGVESMSQIPFFISARLKELLVRFQHGKTLATKARAALSLRLRDLRPRVGLLLGLTDPTCRLSMGQTAEILARELGISRIEQDSLALMSHRRAVDAWERGAFNDELMTVLAPPRYEESITFDNGVRLDETLDDLARLKPFFDPADGTVTAGNASQVTDGGAAVLVASEKAVSRYGLEPLGYVKEHVFSGLSPKRMGLGPVFATADVLRRSGTKFSDVGLIEMNEAFAAQIIANEMVFKDDALSEHYLGTKAIGTIDRDILNVNGGAIAMGHPVGATGTRLVHTLLLEMRRRKVDLGLATLCVGGGQGAAMLLERG